MRWSLKRQIESPFIGKPVCDDHWDDKDAQVVCRMLGFNKGVGFLGLNTNGGHPFGNVPRADFSMDDVNCTGSEQSILDCPHKTKHNCSVKEGAGLRCSN